MDQEKFGLDRIDKTLSYSQADPDPRSGECSSVFCGYVLLQQVIDLDLDGMNDLVYFTHEKMKFFRRTRTSGPAHFVMRQNWGFLAWMKE